MYASSSSKQPDDAPRYTCVCRKYNQGQSHMVSGTTWRRHLEEANTEDERERMCTGRALNGHSIPALSVPPAESSAPVLPPSVRRLDAIRGLAKRARENAELSRKVGRRKRAKQTEPSMAQVRVQYYKYLCTHLT